MQSVLIPENEMEKIAPIENNLYTVSQLLEVNL